MVRLPRLGAIGLIAAGVASIVLAQESTLPSIQLEREDTTITVQQTAPDAEGGEFFSRTFDEASACSEGGETLTVVYAPDPYLVETTVNETRLTSNIVIRRQPEGDQDQATLELFGGTLEFNEETFCPENIQRSDQAEVTLVEGRTAITGSVFNYDNSTGLGVMDGPIELVREAAGDSPALNATSETLEFNVDEDITVLKGNVTVTSEDRTSSAELLEYDEEAGIAVLHGDPAVSQQGENRVEGQVITYYLDSNDVVVKEGISATLEYEPGDEAEEPAEGEPEVP